MADRVHREAFSASDEEKGAACVVVGVGASAGGLEAFRRLLSKLPENSGLAYVLIQHLDPVHESQLAELLAKASRLPVAEATDRTPVVADHIYIIPPNVNIALEPDPAGGNEAVLRLSPRQEVKGPNLPVDFFFRSLAEHCKDRAIGVVLSGSGSDGVRGLAEIKAAGGITFAQDEDSAEYFSMPQSAVAAGCVDFVLPPERIASELARVGQHSYLRQRPHPGSAQAGERESENAEFDAILTQLREATGADFSEYRPSTIRRRIGRRMALRQRETLSDYLDCLRANPEENEALYRDMLINVTSFFRDPEVFEMLKTAVFPEIIKGKSQDNPLRIWVPGCSTGQEAYSLAMALLEFLDQRPAGGRPRVQIFGTDISDAAAVEKARPGIYPPNIEAEVSPERLQRFFTKAEGGYRITQSIRDLCIFARQDLTRDPPFSRIDLISCRNLLIYLAPSLQSRIIPTFHYSLNPGGFLLLGPAESIGKFTDLFVPVDRPHSLFSRTAARIRPPHVLVGGGYPATTHLAEPTERAPALADLRREADRVIMGRFAPAAVLVDDNMEILQFRGDTAPYLQLPSGQPTHNLLKMARESLFMELRSALEEARKSNAPARREQLLIPEQPQRRVNLEVSPIRLPGLPQRCFLVLFIEASGSASTPAPAPGIAPAPPAGEEARANAAMRQELASVKEYLQAIIEQQNAANEELQSANEEIRSANEELQSTNEEMQTSKEELQSANEELRTVNDELQARNQEVAQVNDDFANTLESIKLPIVMLGRDLRIRRFTPAAGELLNLISADIGRVLVDLAPGFQLPDLAAALGGVIAKVEVKQQEVQDRDGRWYLLRMHPYRTSDHRIDGVVLVLRDIDQEKRTKEQLVVVSNAKDHFLAVLSHELRNPLTPVLQSLIALAKLVPPEGKEFLEVAHRNVDLEARLIDDLLDVTRITRGKVELDRQPVELSTILQHAAEVCQADIDVRRLHFGIKVEGGPHIVLADAARLQQVFWNLIKNAVKFTPPGGSVGLRCYREANRVMVQVTDTGAGIEPAAQARIFAPFEQETRSTTREFGGLGLGLAISKGLVEMHAGTISASSEGKGKGATFTVSLPLYQAALPARAGKEPTPKAAPAPLRPLHILMVEDHGDTARIMSRLLQAEGHRVTLAGDVASALDLAGREKFDVLLSDLGLPDGTGYDLMRQLVAAGRKLPAIALSGYGQPQDLAHSREAGFNAHLTKPINIEHLRKTIAEVIA